eukprot:GHVR01006115.1.p1 GENE.GHVR01006115.1~~GHVR01006115.1.p1  ORF type:complete len:196 (-),score=18.14 GHVR01006115.1:66-653(-)
MRKKSRLDRNSNKVLKKRNARNTQRIRAATGLVQPEAEQATQRCTSSSNPPVYSPEPVVSSATSNQPVYSPVPVQLHVQTEEGNISSARSGGATHPTGQPYTTDHDVTWAQKFIEKDRNVNFPFNSCFVCHGWWPDITLRKQQQGHMRLSSPRFRCKRCANDNALPKKLSAENYMIPSDVPAELQGMTFTSCKDG